MNEKKLFERIIIGSFLFYLIIALFLLPLNDNTILHMTLHYSIHFVLTIPFYIIILLYCKLDTILKRFAITVIASKLFNIGTVYILLDDNFSAFNKIYLAVASMVTIVALFYSATIILQEKFDKNFGYSMVFIGLVMFFFESANILPLFYILESVWVYQFIVNGVILATIIVIVKVKSIRYLIEFKKTYKPVNKEVIFSIDAIKELRESGDKDEKKSNI